MTRRREPCSSCWGFLLLLLLLSSTAVLVQSWRLPSLARPSPAASTTSALYTTPSSSTTTTAGSTTSTQQQQPLPPLLEGDVVEFLITDAQRAKGQLPPNDTRKLGLGVINTFGAIHPLCRRKADSEELFVDEDQDAIEGEETVKELVVRVLTQVWFSQRCIEDRKINPHGEEAEDMFIVEEALTEGCGPAERY